MQLLSVIQVTFYTLRRTRTLWLAVAAPLFIVAFRTLLFAFTPEAVTGAWANWIEGNYSFWIGIILLMTMALNIAWLVDIDRSAQSWKQLFALPISRTSVYIAKLIVVVVLVLTSGLLLLVASLIVGYLLALIHPQFGFTKSVPDVIYYVNVIILSTVALFPIMAIYLWLSIRTRNFIFPVCLGIAGAVMNLVAYANVGFQRFSPWMYGLDILRIFAKQPSTQPYLGWPLAVLIMISIVGTILVVLPGMLEFSRRDIY